MYPVYLPDLRISSGSGFSSIVTIRNNSASFQASVNTSYFNANGTLVSHQTDTIPANGNITFNPPNGVDSAIVVSSQDIAVAVLQERISPYAIDTYSGVDRPSTTVHVPIVQNNNSGWVSDLFIQNAGNAPTDAAIEFRKTDGTGLCTKNETGIQPGARRKLTVTTVGCSGTVLTAKITASQPLAVTSTQYPGDAQFIATENRIADTLAVYAPLVQSRAPTPANWRSGLAILNASTGAATLSSAYYNPTSGSGCGSFSYNIAALGSKIVYPAPDSGNTCNYGAASAILSSGSSIAANVNQLFEGLLPATTYLAIANPTQTAFIPRLSASNNWVDAFVVQNATNNSANVTVTFYNSNGSVNSGPSAYTLNARGNTTIFAPSFTGNGIGSAVVTANRPIAVAVNHFKPTVAGDNIGSHAATHR